MVDNKMLRIVGRLQAIEEALKKVLDEMPAGEGYLHAVDLIVMAKDAAHRATLVVWMTKDPAPTQSEKSDD